MPDPKPKKKPPKVAVKGSLDRGVKLDIGDAEMLRPWPEVDIGEAQIHPAMFGLGDAEMTPEQESRPVSIDEAGLLEPGNVDMTRRPHVKNADGSTSTVRSMGFQDGEHGPEIVVPTVHDDGYIMDNDEAIAEYDRTGKHMGKYSSPWIGALAGERMHREQMERPPVDSTPKRPPMGRVAPVPGMPPERDYGAQFGRK